jgi:hypothetical protein
LLKKVRPYFLGAAIAAVAALPLVMSGGSAGAAATYNIRAGGGETGYTVNQYLSSTLSINTGNTGELDVAHLDVSSQANHVVLERELAVGAEDLRSDGLV